ncbi:MAG: hypothetical protein HOH02_05785 [Oceanospirillaceae bacterium]|jgi:Tfp pilus assembly protein PilF|nr:hypothetical protein [Oceanospirillaceae bacterium]MBT4443283.1 hypothetical protein [Oceanospirillaceae bacterium]MBT6077454.1 hypothetical protein [Oceanospirillaceae bacterium]
MLKRNLKSLGWVLGITLSIGACATPFSPEHTQRSLAADIYAQLALGYIKSGHLELAHQRLLMALEFGPNRPLTLKATQRWQKQQTLQPQ